MAGVTVFKSTTDQYPLNVGGPKGQNAFVGIQQIHFTGLTGLVGTSFGFNPAITATRTTTGCYDLAFPSAKQVSIIPNVRGPTGLSDYRAKIRDINQYSGTAKLHITKPAGLIASGHSAPSMSAQVCNPPSGMCVELMFFVSPTVEY
jgi:hypothetical protein